MWPYMSGGTNEQFLVIGGVSSHLFVVYQGLLELLARIDTNFTFTSKDLDKDGDFAELYMSKGWGKGKGRGEDFGASKGWRGDGCLELRR